ncbi:MAG: ABC transporter ATP-binding protein [Proteobacteria bacterium]|nr:ABC transporter ATP-binding protein [Pseudomonadota bacterium]
MTTTSSNTELIKVEEISVRYGKLVAIDSLSFSISPGSIVGLVGPNGAGKTTLLKVLATLLIPTAGRALIDGFDVVGKASYVRRLIGYRPDFDGLYQDMTATEYLAFFADAYQMENEARSEFIRRSLDLTNLTDRKDSFIENLSFGMRAKLSFAKTLAGNPKLLILDEPFAGLDPVARDDLLDTLLRIKEQGKTMIISSHILNDLQKICDRVLLIDKGRFIDKSVPAQDSTSVYEIKMAQILDNMATRLAEINGVEKVDETSEKDRFIIKMKPNTIPAEVLKQLVHGGFDVASFSPAKSLFEESIKQTMKGESE